MEIGDNSGYGPDVGIMWAAYLAGSFEEFDEGLTQEQFVELLLSSLSKFDSIWMVDDFSSQFRSGRGPVTVFGINTDGEIAKMSARTFKWASKKNILRAFVSFTHMMRYSSRIGAMVWYANEKHEGMYVRMREYGIPVYRIGNGYFALAGRKKPPRDP